MPLSVLEGYKPSDLGLPEYEAYRTHPETGEEIQLEVIEHLAYSEARVPCASVPVGCGKSLISLSLAKLLGLRTAIIAPFKGLQDQYSQAFKNHIVDLRGKSNYQCGEHTELDCKAGASLGCRFTQGGGCEYERKRDEAREAQVVVTNYDYWLSVGGGICRQGVHAEELGPNPIELLILDEGDEAATKLADYLSVRVYEKEVDRWAGQAGYDVKAFGEDIDQWKKIVGPSLKPLRDEIKTLSQELVLRGKRITRVDVDYLHGLERTLEKFEKIAGMQAADWVLEKHIGGRFGRVWNFDVVFAGRYNEALFCGIQKVMIMAGTLTVKDLAWLGLSKEDYDYRQWSRIFPANRQPIYLCPPRKVNKAGETVNVNLKRDMHEEDKLRWVEWIDQIIDGRLDRKGLLITSSYEYQKYIMENSRHGERLVGNKSRAEDADNETAEEVAEDFYKLGPGRYLIGPSFGRGWNFEYERSEFVIITKCPFVPVQGKVMQARLLRDPQYADHLCMKKVEQGAGRVMRAANDRGEVFLADGQFVRFMWKSGGLAQKWFSAAVRKVIEVPKPGKKLVRGVDY